MNLPVVVRGLDMRRLAIQLGAAYRWECRTNEIYQIGSLRPMSGPELADGIKSLLLANGARLTLRHFPRSAVVCVWAGWLDSMSAERRASGSTELEALHDVLLMVTDATTTGELRP